LKIIYVSFNNILYVIVRTALDSSRLRLRLTAVNNIINKYGEIFISTIFVVEMAMILAATVMA
jgi:hypothetical protein